MPFYEIEYTIENLTNDIEKRNDSQQEQQEGNNPEKYMSQANKMIKGNQSSSPGKGINIPKMPKMPGTSGMKF